MKFQVEFQIEEIMLQLQDMTLTTLPPTLTPRKTLRAKRRVSGGRDLPESIGLMDDNGDSHCPGPMIDTSKQLSKVFPDPKTSSIIPKLCVDSIHLMVDNGDSQLSGPMIDTSKQLSKVFQDPKTASIIVPKTLCVDSVTGNVRATCRQHSEDSEFCVFRVKGQDLQKSVQLVFEQMRISPNLHMFKCTELNRYSSTMMLSPDLFTFYSQKTSIVLGLPETAWNDVFRHLSVPDLKSFRSTCRAANSMVENSLAWAINVCFVHNEKVHPRIRINPKIPCAQICDDDTVGWPVFRMRNFISPVSGKKYFSKVINSVKTLEMHDCSLHWIDLFEVIGCLPNLKEFVYKHTSEYLHQNNVLKVIKSNLKDYSEITNALKKAEYKRYRSYKTFGSKNLKRVQLQALNLEITNFIIAILDQLCKNVEDLEIIFLENLYFVTSSQPAVGQPCPVLDAWQIINNNQKSLSCLRIAFINEMKNRRIQPHWFDITNTTTMLVPIAPTLSNALYPLHKNLVLRGLVLEFPMAVEVQAKPIFPESTREEFAKSESHLLAFCESQLTSVDYLCLKTVHDDCYRIEKILLSSLHKPFPNKIKIGKLMHCFNKAESITWSAMVKASYEFNLCLDDSSLPYDKIFVENMPVMTNFSILQVEVRTLIPLHNFNISRLVLKLPNLNRLVLIDGNLKGLHPNNEKIPTHKYDDSPKITDFDMQAIICSLPWLAELVLQCNMSKVTDFGLTGIINGDRMLKQGQYITHIGDIVGHSISKMKHLQILELHGLSEKVTGVTAHFAFRSCSLEELYLFSPKFSKRQKKEIRDMFSYKKNFKMIIL